MHAEETVSAADAALSGDHEAATRAALATIDPEPGVAKPDPILVADGVCTRLVFRLRKEP